MADPSPPAPVLAMTGASGAPYAIRLLRVLCQSGRTVHLTISPSAAWVLREELGLNVSLNRFDPAPFGDLGSGRILYHHHEDFSASIASGSARTAGMVILPCSMSTLGAIAHGISTNLITRAADVHLKERRKLILVPRETPLSLIHLENMTAVTRAGAIVLPAMPGWYHQPSTLDDLIDFVVARICDQLGVPHHLTQRWGESLDPPPETPVPRVGDSETLTRRRLPPSPLEGEGRVGGAHDQDDPARPSQVPPRPHLNPPPPGEKEKSD